MTRKAVYQYVAPYMEETTVIGMPPGAKYEHYVLQQQKRKTALGTSTPVNYTVSGLSYLLPTAERTQFITRKQRVCLLLDITALDAIEGIHT